MYLGIARMRTSATGQQPANPDSAASVASDISAAHSGTAALSAAADRLLSELRGGDAAALFFQLEAQQAGLRDTFPCSFGEDMKHLNRYADVLPYDHCRITLAEPAQSSARHAPSTYINASMLAQHPDGGAPSRWRYIASQGPLASTRAGFWQMVVEQAAPAIVMLTSLTEGRRKKCEPYFPLSAYGSVRFGDVQVQNLGQEEGALGIIRRKLVVHGVPGCPERGWPVEHFQLAAWPDHGLPSSPEPLLALSAALRTSPATAGVSPAPIVVHCSAGIGRSGVFCAVDAAARELAAAGDEVAAALQAVDVGRIVSAMRHQRAGMVQTKDQFIFCHVALLELVRAALKEVQART